VSTPDFHALRLKLRNAPDEMVHDTAGAILRMLPVETAESFVWVIESYERLRPRIHSVTVQDTIKPREALG
jgi:hypothetical protein